MDKGGSATTCDVQPPCYPDDDGLLIGARIFVNLATRAA